MSAANELPRHRGAKPTSQQQFSVRSKSCSIASLATSVSIISAASGGADSWQYTTTAVRRVTPILFATNRGLHLRVAHHAALVATEDGGGTYEINFCDLERWSTNRANTVSLRDPQMIVEKQDVDNDADQEKAYDTSIRTFSVTRGSLQYSNPATKREQAQVHFNKICSRNDKQNTTTESKVMMFH